MTVRRKVQETFELERGELAERVREVLRESPAYRDTVEVAGASFATNVKPNPLFSDTAMRIRLREDDERGAPPKTVVDVTTVSQPWTMADPFGFYDRYILDFLAALKRRVEGGPVEAPNPVRFGLPRDAYEWANLAAVLLVAVLFVALPAGLAALGLWTVALSVVFYPVGAAAGFALAKLVSGVRRRFGTLVAILVAVVVYAPAFALLLAAEFVAVDLLLDGRGRVPATPANGLLLGVVLWFISGVKPEGYEGPVNEAREVRGLRGIGQGYRRWILGGPRFPRNWLLLALALVPSIPLLALGVLLPMRGAESPALLMFPILAVGNVALGVSETLELRPVRANAALRVAGLLCLLVLFPALVLLGLLR